MSSDSNGLEFPSQSLLEEVVSILTDDDLYDEPLSARAHMVKNVVKASDLSFEEAIGAAALSLTSPLGLLVSDARERIERIVAGQPGLSVSDIETEMGFIADKDDLVTVAAYQAARDGLLRQEKRRRLQYLYGGASAYLDFEIDAEEFSDRVTELASSDPPSMADLPLRVQAAEFKQQGVGDLAEVPKDVRRVLALDPEMELTPESESLTEADGSDVSPASEPIGSDSGPATEKDDSDSGAATDERGSEPAPVSKEIAEFWGCPYCASTQSSLGGIQGHMTSVTDGPHGDRGGKSPDHHIPAYDGSGRLVAALERPVFGQQPQVVRAETVDPDGWYTDAQREAAGADVPLRTTHNADRLDRAPDAEDIISDVDTSSRATDGQAVDQSEADAASKGGTEPGGESPSDSAAPEAMGAESQSQVSAPTGNGAAPDPGDGGTSSGAGSPAEVSQLDAGGATPEDRESESSTTQVSDSGRGSAPDPDASATSDDEQWEPIPNTGDNGGLEEATAPGPILPEAAEGGRSPEPPSESDDPAGDTAPEEETDPQPEGNASTDQSGVDVQEDAPGRRPEDEEAQREAAQAGDSPSSQAAVPPSSDRVAPGLIIEDSGSFDIQSVADRDAVIETAVAIDQSAAIDEADKPAAMARLVEQASVEISPAAVRTAVEERVSPDRTASGSGPAAVDQAGETHPSSTEGNADGAPRAGSVSVQNGVLHTPVGTVATQGDLADAAVEIYTTMECPIAEKARLVREMARHASEIGISVTADQLFEMLEPRIGRSPRPPEQESPHSLADRNDVIERALRIANREGDAGELAERILDLVDTAQAEGIDITYRELLAALKDQSDREG